MQKAALEAILSGIGAGQVLELRFSEAATEAEALYLKGMLGNIVEIPKLGDAALLEAVIEAGWERDRTIRVTTLDGFDSEWFIGRLARGLDSCRKM